MGGLMAETIGVMGEQQIVCTAADTWYVVVAPSTACRLLIEAEADGRYTTDGSVADGAAVGTWGSGVRGVTMPAAVAAVDEIPSHRRIAVSSSTAGSRVGITFLDEVG